MVDINYRAAEVVNFQRFLPIAHALRQPLRVERLITALVFAAKSDGHIDERERQHIEEQLRAANIDVQGRVLIDRVLTQPLDPQRLAQSVRDGQEALEIYYLS
ncbi:DUF533 domain-containing protein, partial [Klebsiella aerogenes]|uniref:DUF533 domain-containing protein n=1 Tax=Klebsiella aerogenes TaxID=548 RepID=UPI00387827D9